MADYVIWGRVEQLAPGEFLGIVSAVPAGLVIPGAKVDSVISSTREGALNFVSQAAIALGELVRQGGGHVVDVDVD